MIQFGISLRKRSILGACLAAVLFLGAVDSAAQYLGPGDFEYPLIEFDARISYGSDSLQYADLRLPDGDGPHPVIVLLHGGCWQGLHRPRHVERLAVALTDAGWATWNLSHRQAPDAGGGWTGTFEDVSNGIDRLRKVAQKYELNLDAVVTMGHSAGGHLAIWAGARSRVPEDSEIHYEDPLSLAGAISLGGIPDLEAHYNQEVNPCGKGVTDEQLGPLSSVFAALMDAETGARHPMLKPKTVEHRPRSSTDEELLKVVAAVALDLLIKSKTLSKSEAEQAVASAVRRWKLPISKKVSRTMVGNWRERISSGPHDDFFYSTIFAAYGPVHTEF